MDFPLSLARLSPAFNEHAVNAILLSGVVDDYYPLRMQMKALCDTAIVGKGREDAGTQPLMESANMRIRTYNMQDEQFASHRALRSEEGRIQFRGDALDLSEFENVEVFPGEITIIPLGISHSVISIPPEDENFLRLNFYSKVRWRVPIDPTKHHFDSKFARRPSTSRRSGGRNLRRRGESRKNHKDELAP